MTATPEQPLVLASTSPYRARLLARLRLPFSTLDPGVDETPLAGESGPALAARLAMLKARAGGTAQGTYIGSDQVAVCNGHILGKPGTAARACEQLARCAGQTTTFYTGLAVWQPGNATLHQATVPFNVRMRALSAREIEDYVSLDQPLDCAGSFKWESLGIALFDAMDGEDPTALEGLPLIALGRILRELGFALPPRPQAATDPL